MPQKGRQVGKELQGTTGCGRRLFSSPSVCLPVSLSLVSTDALWHKHKVTGGQSHEQGHVLLLALPTAAGHGLSPHSGMDPWTRFRNCPASSASRGKYTRATFVRSQDAGVAPSCCASLCLALAFGFYFSSFMSGETGSTHLGLHAAIHPTHLTLQDANPGPPRGAVLGHHPALRPLYERGGEVGTGV